MADHAHLRLVPQATEAAITVGHGLSGKGYIVSVLWKSHDDGVPLGGTYETLKEAWGYASGLRMVKGWPIVDMTGEPA